MDHIRPCRPNEARSWIVAALAASLAACSVQSPPAIQATVGNAPTAPSSIHLVEPEAEQTQRLAFHAAVKERLLGRGITLTEDAKIVGDLAVSVSPSPIGLYASEAGESDEEPSSIATTRERRWYDACEAVRVQASLVLFDRDSGKQMKSSKAESMSCADAEPAMTEMATLLVDDLLSD